MLVLEGLEHLGCVIGRIAHLLVSQQFQAFKDGRVAALADDNTYLYAWAKDNPGYTVGIKTIGDESTIARP